MFNNCSLLSDIELLGNWNVSKGTDFSNMFNNCINLKYIEEIEKWNVLRGENFTNMFNNCQSLSISDPYKIFKCLKKKKENT